MARVYITEFSHIGLAFGNNVVQAPKVPPLAEQSMEIFLKSTASKLFNGAARLIMVHNEIACHYAFGKSPVAQQLFHKVGPGETRFYAVEGGDRLAVVEALE